MPARAVAIWYACHRRTRAGAASREPELTRKARVSVLLAAVPRGGGIGTTISHVPSELRMTAPMRSMRAKVGRDGLCSAQNACWLP